MSPQILPIVFLSSYVSLEVVEGVAGGLLEFSAESLG